MAVALAAAAVSADAMLLVHRMPTLAVTPPGSGDGAAYLLLASDSRERLSGRDRTRYADRTQADGERADLVLVLRRPAGGEPRLVSIPRDLFVGAAAGSPHRLGMALGDGPQAMVTSLCTDLGIGVDPTRSHHALDVLGQTAGRLDDPLTVQRALWSVGPRLRRDGGLGVVAAGSLARDLRAALHSGRLATVPVRQSATAVPVAFPTRDTDTALEPFRTRTCADRSPTPNTPHTG